MFRPALRPDGPQYGDQQLKEVVSAMKPVPTKTAERYRVVTTYPYDEPLTIASVPMGREHALALFSALLMSGGYSPTGGRRTRVMSVDECERWGYR